MALEHLAGKTIYVASPYSGDVENNVRFAQDACRMVLSVGSYPYAPHLYLTNILRDEIPEERERGIKAGMAYLAICDELWVFGNRISAGMKGEIKEAERLGKPVRYFDLDFMAVEH